MCFYRFDPADQPCITVISLSALIVFHYPLSLSQGKSLAFGFLKKKPSANQVKAHLRSFVRMKSPWGASKYCVG